MISEWRRQSKSAGLWQYQTFRHGPRLHWTVKCALCARNTFLFLLFSFHILWSFWRGHMWRVCLEWRTDWIDCEHSLFTLCSWLRRRKVKIKKSLVASAASSVALALFHHSHRIVDSSWQSSPCISPKDCFKHSKFWGVNNFSYKLISR